jgi:dTDP-4-amino-4,6-dideoxygalactose transaminase
MGIPLFDPLAVLAPLRDQLHAAVDGVLERGQFVLGDEVAAFEDELAAYLGVRHAVGVANGTDAITIALQALGVGPGDEVVVPAFTFYASAEAIPPTGARPVFCDVEPDTLCVSAATVRAALTGHTKAVVAVHLFGNVAPVAEIEALGVPVVEDTAQALGSLSAGGARAGGLGMVSTHSFFPSKNLGAFGDAGAIATNDAAIADTVRALRFHGSRDKLRHDYVGWNSRLDELQAAILRVQLPHLDDWCARRRTVARWYAEAGIEGLARPPVAAPGSHPAWHLYVVRRPGADDLCAALAAGGIEARGYYRTPLHRQPAMAPYAAGAHLPVTDEAAHTNLALPMGAWLDAGHVREVVDAMRTATDR